MKKCKLCGNEILVMFDRRKGGPVELDPSGFEAWIFSVPLIVGKREHPGLDGAGRGSTVFKKHICPPEDFFDKQGIGAPIIPTSIDPSKNDAPDFTPEEDVPVKPKKKKQAKKKAKKSSKKSKK